MEDSFLPKTHNHLTRFQLRISTIFFFLFYFEICQGQGLPARFEISIESTRELTELLHYSPNGIKLVSSHRGGPVAGFPENCIETFENTISRIWSIMEIDPHYTEDSVIILMHDDTLDRTSTGRGKISDFTFAEIREMRLLDPEGKITQYHIPKLSDAIEWAKGKSILIIDKKDVPVIERAKIIKQLNAEKNAMIMCYNYEEAKDVYDFSKDIMMEVFIADRKEAAMFEKYGIPWSNIVAFVGHGEPRDPEIFNYLHDRGVMTIRGSSRTIDKEFIEGSRDIHSLIRGYQLMLNTGTDIIEADLGIMAGLAVQNRRILEGVKSKYFGLQ